MADNVTLNSGSGGATIAADDISSVWYQRVKVVWGGDGVANDTAAANPLPVVQTGTHTVTGAGGTFPVTDSSGSLTVDAPVGTPVFVRLSDGSAAISTLPVSLASVPSHAVTNAGTFAVQVDGSALTALQLIDDPVITDDAAFTPATSKVMMAGFEYDDTTPDSVDEGDAGAARMSARREVYVQLRDAAGNERGLNIDGSGNLTANITGTVTVGSHAVTNAGTFAVQESGSALTALQLIDDAVQTEDSAHSTGHKGFFALAVRSDTAAQTAGTDGDYCGLICDSAGKLHVNVGNTVTVGSHAVTNAGTFAVQVDNTVTVAAHHVTNAGTFAVQAAMSGTWTMDPTTATSWGIRAEDAAHSTGHAGVFALTVRSDTAASTAGTDGDYAAFTTDSTGRLHVNVGNTVTVASHAVTNAGTFAVQVDNTVTVASHHVTNAGTFAVQATIASGATSFVHAEDDASANLDAGAGMLAVRKATPANTSGADGDYEFLQMSAGRLWVDPSGVTLTVASHAVTNAGTFATQIDGAALTSLQLIDDAVSGTGFNISQMNGVAVTMGNGASGTGVQRVTIANDSTGILAGVTTVTTLAGSSIAHDAADSGSPHKIGAKATAALSTATMVADADRTNAVSDLDGAIIVREQFPLGDLLSERVSNTDGASTAFTNFGATASTRNVITAIVAYNSSASAGYIDFRDGTAGAILFTVPIPAGGGAVLPAGSTPYFKTTANTALAYDVSAALTTVIISISGFKSKVT